MSQLNHVSVGVNPLKNQRVRGKLMRTLKDGLADESEALTKWCRNSSRDLQKLGKKKNTACLEIFSCSTCARESQLLSDSVTTGWSENSSTYTDCSVSLHHDGPQRASAFTWNVALMTYLISVCHRQSSPPLRWHDDSGGTVRNWCLNASVSSSLHQHLTGMRTNTSRSPFFSQTLWCAVLYICNAEQETGELQSQ